MQEKGKVIDLEPEEEVEEIPMDDEDTTVETEDGEVEGYEPISKLPMYIPLHRGKTKVLQDIDESKVYHESCNSPSRTRRPLR